MRITTLITASTVARAAVAASLTKVDYANNATSTVDMYIYIPDTVVENPPLVVVLHSCQSTAQSYFQGWGSSWKQGSDNKGYITLWPSSPYEGTCWDVSSRRSLSHDGGGDTQAISSMILHAIEKYKVNPEKVFVTGTSSGGMMSNVLAATYPELISAVSAYSGVAAGCFMSEAGGIAAWNSSCSSGRSQATPEKWGDVAREMFPGYTGQRPRMQIWHGSTDTTVSPQNYQEQIKQWTNVFGVAQTPTTTRMGYPQPRYKTDDYGDNVQGIYAFGVGHALMVNLTASEMWFGL